MSSINIHTVDLPEVTVHGSERGRGFGVAIDTTMGALGVRSSTDVRALVAAGRLPAEALAATAFGKTPMEALHRWLLDPMDMNRISLDGEQLPVGDLVLNTAAVAGPDAVAFLARLHGSVEDRLWVAAVDTDWFADVLTAGLADGSLLTRADGLPGDGWESAAAAARTTTGPVGISSSQGRSFHDVAYAGDDDEEEGHVLTFAESFARLDTAQWWLQLTPDNLRRPAYRTLATLDNRATR